ncbi:MAG: formyltransferase family protein [Thermodesulfobacteriota bacterium]|nr:formyltransferase family protein [Thermodesulfobacteriota bacterium]
MVFRIGWFSTGRDKAARDLLHTICDCIDTKDIRARISFVFCNRKFGENKESDKFIRMVREYGIDLVCFSSRDFKPKMRSRVRKDPDILKRWRTEYNDEIIEMLAKYTSDLNILAGYMQIVSKKMCDTLDMINLHPAAPGGPSGSWQEVIWKLIESKSDKTGVMIHLVTEVLDQGSPVTFCTFPIRGPLFDTLWDELYQALEIKDLSRIKKDEGEKNKLFKEIRRQGFRRELPLLLQTIKEFADRKLRIKDKSVFIGDGVLEGGLCLSKEIDAYIYSKSRPLQQHVNI